MIEPESSAPPLSDPFPAGTVDAAIYATQAEAFEHSLVVLAMGEACWLVTTDAGHHLRVELPALEAIRRQLECFDRESAGWPPRAPAERTPVRRPLPVSPMLWAVAVFAVFRMQETRRDFTDTWLLDARRVFDHGEWWRAASALWLHQDFAHLVSNAGSGLLVFSALVVTMGLRAGWSLLALAAVAGNVAAVALHHADDYRSLGASTAIFAGLGLLVGRAVRAMSRSDHPHRWRAVFVPLAAGLSVLGLFGAGGINIDVLAHATGFGAGLVLGFVAARFPRESAPEPREPR